MSDARCSSGLHPYGVGRFVLRPGEPSCRDQLSLRATGRNCSVRQDTDAEYPNRSTMRRLVSVPLADARYNACCSQITMLDRDTDLICEILPCTSDPEFRER